MELSRNDIQKKTLKSITYRYVTAVFLIAASILIAFYINQKQHKILEEDFRIINLSGRQRMLSQRIALLMHNPLHEKELKLSLKEFEDGLIFLRTTRFINNSEIKKRFQVINASTEEFLKLTTNSQRTFELSQIMLKNFDEVTHLIQKESESEYAKRHTFEYSILFITLGILLLEVLGIFRPMVKEVRRVFSDLNRIEDLSYEQARLVMIGETAASLGHEISNPLSVIKVSAELSQRMVNKKDENWEDLGRYQSNIIRYSNIIEKIIKSLRTQSRQSAQDPHVDADLSGIVDDAVDLFESRLKMNNITIMRALPESTRIRCRPAAISQVIANLISNSIDALSEMKNDDLKVIRIEALNDYDALLIRIQDSGLGVKSGMEDKIFKSFTTTKGLGKGTGLGLSVSKKIMQEHQGDITLNKHISRSCFELRFPKKVA